MSRTFPTDPIEKTFEQLLRHHLQHRILDHGSLEFSDATQAACDVFRQLQQALGEQLGAQQTEHVLLQAMQHIRQQQGIPNR